MAFVWGQRTLGMGQRTLGIHAFSRHTGKSTFTQAYMLQYQQYLDQFTWCRENFGETSRDRWWYIDGEFKFVDSKDEVLFRLRWS